MIAPSHTLEGPALASLVSPRWLSWCLASATQSTREALGVAEGIRRAHLTVGTALALEPTARRPMRFQLPILLLASLLAACNGGRRRGTVIVQQPRLVSVLVEVYDPYT